MMAYQRDRKTARFLEKLRALFNLNDPGWGRSSDSKPKTDGDSNAPQEAAPARPSTPEQESNSPKPPEHKRPPSSNGGRNNNAPPDLDQLWQDFSGKFGKMFGKGGNKPSMGGNNQGGGSSGGMRAPSIGGGLILIVLVIAFLLWLASGIFIVQEGYQSVITRFGQYERTVNAGVNYRWPAPIGRNESVQVSQIQSADIGSDRVIKETGLNHYAMLTQDENIVEVRFAVQYRLSDARAYLFETQDPRAAVVTAAESAVREVVGKMQMDNVLAGERDQIAPRVRELMQVILDRYGVGVEVVAINMQQSGVRPPEQVRDAFDDVLRADQERERAKNEAEAYANNVIPRAVGEASRIEEEAQAYRDRVIAESQGDADRFLAVLAEYQKAPRVTRERMYLDAMQDIYSKTPKVIVDSNGSNGSMMYLPIDKLLENSKAARANNAAGGTSSGPVNSNSTSSSVAPASSNTNTNVSGALRPTRDAR